MKTSDLLIVGGIGIAAYFLLTRQAQGSNTGGGGRGSFQTPLPPPTTDTFRTGIADIMTGQSNYYRAVSPQTGAGIPVTAQQLGINVARYVYSQPPISGVSIARAVYSGGFGVPSVPANVMTGQSVRADQPFNTAGMTAFSKPVGFK